VQDAKVSSKSIPHSQLLVMGVRGVYLFQGTNLFHKSWCSYSEKCAV